MAKRSQKAKPATGGATAPNPIPRNERPKVSRLTPEGLQQRIMVRPREFSELTGTPLPTVYKYIATGRLRSSRLGSTIRIPASEIR
jgi:excisionase family DNA binding protein